MHDTLSERSLATLIQGRIEVGALHTPDERTLTSCVEKMTPFIIRQGAASWPAMKKWTRDYFVNLFGTKVQKARRICGYQLQTREFTVAEYFDYMDQTHEGAFYLTDCQFHLNSILLDDYVAPKTFSCWYGVIPSQQRKRTLSWLYIGAARTYSTLHLDVWNTSAWNAVITGRKLWLFYGKDQESFLGGGNVNPFLPDYKVYPQFRFSEPLWCIQEHGDIVFTPSEWWHAVINLEAGISITENFINQFNYKMVLDYFLSKNNLQAHKTLLRIAEKNLANAVR